MNHQVHHRHCLCRLHHHLRYFIQGPRSGLNHLRDPTRIHHSHLSSQSRVETGLRIAFTHQRFPFCRALPPSRMGTLTHAHCGHLSIRGLVTILTLLWTCIHSPSSNQGVQFTAAAHILTHLPIGSSRRALTTRTGALLAFLYPHTVCQASSWKNILRSTLRVG
jgi:hypothetical protein